jgi:hypothetical protein
MAKQRASRKKVRTLKPPHVRNVKEVKGPIRDGTLLHMTEKQWGQAKKGLRQLKTLPKSGTCLDVYPIPDGDVIVQPNCIQQPCEICRVRTIPTRVPGGGIGFIADCQCKPDPRCDFDPPPPLGPACSLEIRTSGVIGISCQNNHCARNCRLGFVRVQQPFGTMFRIVCTCS